MPVMSKEVRAVEEIRVSKEREGEQASIRNNIRYTKVAVDSVVDRVQLTVRR
jgi:hypothetical protein